MNNTFYLNISTAENLGIGLFKYQLTSPERFIITNSALAHMLGYLSRVDFKRITLDDLFLRPYEKEKFITLLKEQGKVKFFETLFKSKDGKPVWVAITASRVLINNKRDYAEGIIENISEHKETEEKLELERDFMQGLLDSMPDAIYFKDRQNKIIKVNRFYAEGSKLKYEDIIGKTDFDFFPHEQARKMFEDDNYVLSGKSIIGKIERTLLPNGTWNQVITTKIPMYDRGGNIIGTMGITRDMTAYANLERERLEMLINTVMVLGKAMEMRDPYTFSHNRKVADIAEKIGKALNWDENRLLGMKLAGELHDLGKISIPLDILNKPGKLSDLEFKLIQEHVVKCYDLFKDIKFPFSLADIVYQHHERLDGTGYPRGLKGQDINEEARVLAVSDVLEAMTSHRPYREALGLNKAMDELQNGKGNKYDPQIVEIVVHLVSDSGNKIFWSTN
ncbi:MAG: HD domain-containing phosphohydrolase [Candidatus Omnitrophota bacterium]